MINKGFHCIEFNAWESDFAEDPLVAVIAELDQASKAEAGIEKSFAKVRKGAVHLIKRIVPVASKAIVKIDLDKEHKALKKSYSKALFDEQISSYSTYKDGLKNFHVELEDYAKKVAKSKGNEYPIIFFIDELDRCRPSFAVELLERIKHLFNIPGIVFVLAYDKPQLGSSIQTIFGHDMDVDGYLRRFVDLEFKLPKPSTENFVKLLLEKYELEPYFEKRNSRELASERKDISDFFVAMFSSFEFSLRKQEQCFTELSIVLHTTPHTYYLYPEILVPLVILRASNEKLYHEFRSKLVPYKKVMEFFDSKDPTGTTLKGYRRNMLEAGLAIWSCTEQEINEYYAEYESIFKDENIDTDKRDKAQGVIEEINRFLHPGMNRERVSLTYITDKLDFISRFHDFPTEQNE